MYGRRAVRGKMYATGQGDRQKRDDAQANPVMHKPYMPQIVLHGPVFPARVKIRFYPSRPAVNPFADRRGKHEDADEAARPIEWFSIMRLFFYPSSASQGTGFEQIYGRTVNPSSIRYIAIPVMNTSADHGSWGCAGVCRTSTFACSRCEACSPAPSVDVLDVRSSGNRFNAGQQD